jgi:hypothetical protein
MVSTLAQLIALVSHGNAFLNGRHERRHFYPFNSTFRFCNEISFVKFKKLFRVKEIRAARTPNDWFTLLKDNNSVRLWLGYSPSSNPHFPDHKLAGLVGGGGTRYIASTFPKHADYWLGRWEVADQNAPDRRIWNVTYGRVAEKEKLPLLQANGLSSYKDKLENILKQIEAFALKHSLHSWAESFHEGLEVLTSDDPISLIYHKDLLPPEGYSLDAKRLIAACSQAWVFGGMGSWNDPGFEDTVEHQEYERLSQELYETINLCVERGANSYGRQWVNRAA